MTGPGGAERNTDDRDQRRGENESPRSSERSCGHSRTVRGAEAESRARLDRIRRTIDEHRGFLPDEDPLDAFPTTAHERPVAVYLETLDDLAATLPERLESGTLRESVEAMDSPPAGLLESLDDREVRRLATVASFLASGYVHQIGSESVDSIPPGVAIPLFASAERVGRKPIAAYDTICLHNFRRREPDVGFAVENVEPVVRFTDFDDETWFVAIHVAIEAVAGSALVAAMRAQERLVDASTGSLSSENRAALANDLAVIADSLEAQTAIMERMTERNRPEAFAHEYRPYYDGFSGVVFEGVEALGGEPQTLRGGSGAQSSALPSIDAALGIDHAETPLIDKLGDMHSYMPRHHRETLQAYRAGPEIRPFVRDSGDDALAQAFNRCVEGATAFRTVHFEQVIQYIRAVTGDTTGTGGTDFMTFLEQMREETKAQLV